MAFPSFQLMSRRIVRLPATVSVVIAHVVIRSLSSAPVPLVAVNNVLVGGALCLPITPVVTILRVSIVIIISQSLVTVSKLQLVEFFVFTRSESIISDAIVRF